MERLIRSPFPEQELARWLNATLGQALCGLSCDCLPEVSQNSQTRDIIHQVISRTQGHIHIDGLATILPDLSPQEVAHQGVKKILEPLKQLDERNKFGGPWNEWTAHVAATKLGLPLQRLVQQINASGPLGQKLRNEQAAVAKQTEDLLRRQLATSAPENIVTAIKLETWIKRQVQELRQELEQPTDTLSKKAKGEVVSDTIAALLEVLNFTSGQDQPVKLIRDRLLAARQGQTLNVIDLHCPLFINSLTGGVVVDSSPEERVVETTEGKRIKISHDGFFDSVNQFADILAKHHILCQISMVIIDNDKFVMPGQENNVTQLINSLPKIIKQHPISKHAWKIVRASSVVSSEEFTTEWDIRNKRSDTITEKLVDSEFDRLQSKTLPPKMKTRDFARSIARKAFIQQFAFGSCLPEIFDPAIILQRTRAHQQASEIFRLGNKSCSKPGIIIAHWQDREEIV